MSNEIGMGSLDENAFESTILEMQNATAQARTEEPEIKKREIEVPNSMSVEEEAKNDPVETEQEMDPVDREFADKRKLSSLEQEALSKGWRPKDQFIGDPEKFVEAKEFLGRTELFDRISGQNKAINELKLTVKELADMNRKQHEILEREKADYLLQQKRLAIESGNVAEAEKFEEAYHSITNESKQTNDGKVRQPEVQEPHPAAVEFARRNVGWFNDDSEENSTMKNYAIKKEVYLQKLYPEWSDERRLMETERAVKDFFSHKFKNTNRDRAPKVAVSDNQNYSVKSKDKITFNQLPSHYKAIVRRMSQATGLSLDEYAQQLHDLGKIN